MKHCFLIAHELMHIKFKHPLRLFDKDGKQRDSDIWNEATDAIINANLQRDGFVIKKGHVNRPEALNYTAEEFYDILESEKTQGRKSEEQESGGKSDNGDRNDKQRLRDDHSLWEEAFEKEQTPNEGDQKESSTDQKNSSDVNEKEEFQTNRRKRTSILKEKYERMKEQILRDNLKNDSSSKIKFEGVGDGNEAVDWR